MNKRKLNHLKNFNQLNEQQEEDINSTQLNPTEILPISDFPNKCFLASWNTEAFKVKEGENVLFVDEDFFSENRGYNEADYGEINQLDIGEYTTLDNISPDHIIVRIK